MYTFVRLRPGTDVRKIEAGLTEVVTKYRGKEKENVALELQPLKDIHLHSVLAEEAEINGSSRIVLFLSVIGFFVLGIAWINYINLSTARAFERAREVGVRKVMGAGKIQLVSQFLLEALIMNLAAVVLDWGMVLLLLPFFNSLSGLSLSNGSCFRGWFLGWLAFVWLGGTFLSGLYPSLVLSSFRPVTLFERAAKT